MKRRLLPVLMGGGGLDSYIRSLQPIAYWPLTETSGTAAVNYGSLGTAANGTYSGVTLAQVAAPGGGLAPLWDGTNDWCDIYSSALSTGLSKTTGTLSFWAKMYNAAQWTDGVRHDLFTIGYDVAPSYFLNIIKPTANGTISYYIKGLSAVKNVDVASLSYTTWMHIAMSYSSVANEAIAYINGVKTGSTMTGFGALSGTMNDKYCILGLNNTLTQTNDFAGYISRCSLHNSVLTPAEIATMYALRGI